MINKLEKFTMQVVNRKDIHGAEYNPRKITPDAEKRLRKELKDVGLLQPIIVNKRTMNIVGGHRRIDAMDTILKSDSYGLTVAMIDVDEREEVKANILLNNPSVQGEWDTFKLEDLYKEFDLTLDEIGFDREDALVLFDMGDSDPLNFKTEDDEAGQEAKAQENRDHAKATREQKKSSDVENKTDDENDYSLVFVFPTSREKQRLCTLIGQPKSATHIKSSILTDIYRQKYDITKIGRAE